MREPQPSHCIIFPHILLHFRTHVKNSLQEKLASIFSTTENSQAYVQWISSFALRISQYLQSTWNELRVNFQIRLCKFQIWQQTSNNQQAWKRGNPTIKQREDKTTRKNWVAWMSAHFQRSKLPQAFLHCQHALNVAITSNVVHISSWFWFLSTCSTLNCYVSEHRSSKFGWNLSLFWTQWQDLHSQYHVSFAPAAILCTPCNPYRYWPTSQHLF